MKSVLLFLISTLLFFSCKEVEKLKQGSTYEYYPLANIYYDIDEKYYLVFDSAQDAWQQKENLSGEETDTLGKKVVITNPSRPVYKDNDNHRLIYGTVLYSSSEELRQKFIEDSLKVDSAKKVKPIRKVEPKLEAEKKPKRGLKKFFDKIFNKKDKN
jgi:hypothetical protein